LNPGKIGPDPQFPDAVITMKAPPNMENCVDLEYRIVQHPALPGKLGIVAEFQPTENEIALLAAGQPIRFMMPLMFDEATDAPVVPPVALWAKDPTEV
jgi:hypothetical protein